MLSPQNPFPMSIVHAQNLMKRSERLLPQRLAKRQAVAFSHGYGIARSPKLRLHHFLQNSTETRSTFVPSVTLVAMALHPVLTTPLHSNFHLPVLDQGETVSLRTLPNASLSQRSERCKLGEVKQTLPLLSPPLDRAHRLTTISVRVHPVSSHPYLRSPNHTISLEVEARPPARLLVLLPFDHHRPIPSRIPVPIPITVPRPCPFNGGASQNLVTLLSRIVGLPMVLRQPPVHN